jgi:cell division protein FtsL
MKKGMITIVTVSTLVICALFQLFVAHRLSTAGVELTLIENEVQTLTLENEELRHTIASASSLMTVSTKAREMGFVQASFQYVEAPPIARVQ